MRVGIGGVHPGRMYAFTGAKADSGGGRLLCLREVGLESG